MKNRIIILGAGVMGSALAVPASYHSGNKVTLVGSPLDDHLIESIQSDRRHPTLNVSMPPEIEALKLAQLNTDMLLDANVIIIGVSSPGIKWVVGLLEASGARPALLALVTKGLVENPDPESTPLTYADALSESLSDPAGQLIGIGGPCIARELALGYPTRVTFASREVVHAEALRDLLQTPYYRITTHQNIVAVEACAALKNFLAIGVSAMLSAYPLEDGYAKNPVAALYNQAVLELSILSNWISSAQSVDSQAVRTGTDVAFDLPGMGDLHVTVGGGRNSRLGTLLGKGRKLGDVLATDLKGITVEGVDTGKRLAPGFYAACKSGVMQAARVPLTSAILDTIVGDKPFELEFERLPG